jgi:hypothetical protein
MLEFTESVSLHEQGVRAGREQNKLVFSVGVRGRLVFQPLIRFCQLYIRTHNHRARFVQDRAVQRSCACLRAQAAGKKQSQG